MSGGDFPFLGMCDAGCKSPSVVIRTIFRLCFECAATWDAAPEKKIGETPQVQS